MNQCFRTWIKPLHRTGALAEADIHHKNESGSVCEWSADLRWSARWKTAKWNLMRGMRVVAVLVAPSCLTTLSPRWWNLEVHPYLATTAGFGAFIVLSIAEKLFLLAFHAFHRSFGSFIAVLIDRFSRIVLWLLIALFGFFLSGTNPLLMTIGWWLCALPIIAQRWFERQRDLKGARLIDGNYKLVGFVKDKQRWRKKRKIGNGKLFVLPATSPLGEHSVQVLASPVPEIYVGSKVRQALGSNEFGAALAHEFGHAFCTRTVGLELLSWGWRIFGPPVLVSLGLELLHGKIPWLPGETAFSWMTVASLAWLVYRWVSLVLHRPTEYAADRYAVDVTRNHAGFIAGLKRLSAVGQFNVFPNVIDLLGMNSHPCTLWRIRKIEKARAIFDQQMAKKAAKVR